MKSTRRFLARFLWLAVCSFTLGPAPGAWAQPDAQALLKSADQGRGGGFTGLVWEVRTHTTGTGAEDQVDQRLRVKANATASVAEVLEPANSKGARMLQVDRNMWMTKPGLRKPVAISPRQRLTGQAALGDIAATNYAQDYEARYLRQEKIGEEHCHVLDLVARNRQTTYDRILYWVSTRTDLAVKADFLSLSGKRLKSAEFEHGNRIRIKGENLAFVSRMQIADALTDAKTVLQYTQVQVKPLASSEFDVANLK